MIVKKTFYAGSEGRKFSCTLYGPITDERFVAERRILQHRVRHMPVWTRDDPYGEPKGLGYYGWPEDTDDDS